MLHGTAPQAGKEPAPILTATHVGKPGAGWERRTSARTARRLAVPQHPSPTRVPAVTLPGPGRLSSCSVPPADAKTQWQCLAVSSFASRDTVPTSLLADKERKKLKSVWFWSAVLSKASGLLQSKHNSDEGFRLACTWCCSVPPERAVSSESETVGLLQLSEREMMVLLSPCPCA